MVLVLLGYNYGIESPAGSNLKFLKVYIFQIYEPVFVIIEVQQNCIVLHFLLVVIPYFLLITPLLQERYFLNISKKYISKLCVLLSKGSGTYPPVKSLSPKGVVVLSILDYNELYKIIIWKLRYKWILAFNYRF